MKKLAIASLVLLASCSWTERQADDFSNWADKTMPTYDDIKPTGTYTAYPYNDPSRKPVAKQSGNAELTAPPLPGYAGAESSKLEATAPIAEPKPDQPSFAPKPAEVPADINTNTQP